MEALVGTRGINPIHANCRRQQNHLFIPKIVSRVCVKSPVGVIGTSRSKFLNLVVSASFQSAQASTMDRFDNTLPSKGI